LKTNIPHLPSSLEPDIPIVVLRSTPAANHENHE